MCVVCLAYSTLGGGGLRAYLFQDDGCLLLIPPPPGWEWEWGWA